jgi:hypothetical protein
VLHGHPERIVRGVALAVLAGALLALAVRLRRQPKLKDFRIADRGEEVVPAWPFCTARRARARHRPHIWGTSAATEAEQVLWGRSLTYPRGCRRRRVAFPYLVVAGAYGAQLAVKVRGGRLHRSRVRHFRVE